MTDRFKPFKLPPQHLDTLRFCEPNANALSQWLLEQPLGKPKQFSVLLYTLLPEINQLQCQSQTRIDLLDILRPVVYQCVASSHEQHLSQPLQLDKQSTRVAMMSHALLRHLCDGYLIAITTELDSSSNPNPERLAKCIFFALHGLGQLYFHCTQLYASTAPLFWLKAHSLFQLAEEYKLGNESVLAYQSPEENRTIEQAYKRLILLACSHTNQLPQIDITYLYNAFENWADLAEITQPQAVNEYSQCRYWADPFEDLPPHNRDQNKSGEDIGFDFTDLILLLQTHNHYGPGKGVKEIPTFFRHSLAEHLLQCWQRSERRKQARHAIDERFEICVGLENAYTLLNQAEVDDKPVSYVNAVDSSPGGLCLRWQNNVPKATEPGQCLLIRSSDKTLWRIGIIRWVQHLNQFTYAGIQLLSEHVAPTAAKVYHGDNTKQESYPSIAFTNQDSAECGMNLLLPRQLSDTANNNEKTVIETQNGQESIEALDKIEEFLSVHHYTCQIGR